MPPCTGSGSREEEKGEGRKWKKRDVAREEGTGPGSKSNVRSKTSPCSRFNFHFLCVSRSWIHRKSAFIDVTVLEDGKMLFEQIIGVDELGVAVRKSEVETLAMDQCGIVSVLLRHTRSETVWKGCYVPRIQTSGNMPRA